jgi:hypothetical protein
VLVGQDDPPPRVLRPEAGEQAETPQRPSSLRESLLEHVDGRPPVRLQHALGLPSPEGLPRLGVPRVAGCSVQDDAHDVVRVARIQLVTVVGRDDVVGGREDAGEVLGPVPDTRERLDLGQELLRKRRKPSPDAVNRRWYDL